MDMMLAIQQMVRSNKTAFDNILDAMIALHEHVETMTAHSLEHNLLVSAEGKKAIIHWLQAYRRGWEDYRTLLDTSYNDMVVTTLGNLNQPRETTSIPPMKDGNAPGSPENPGLDFQAFLTWLADSLAEEKRFSTLAGRSSFHARYDDKTGNLLLRRSTGKMGRLTKEQCESIFGRYRDGSAPQRIKPSYFTVPAWPDTPDIILTPYVPAIILAFEGEQN